uniref:Uncharacterized protein n=1 Tax=Leptobrachium leishanense TaxID=445787 RepID=A0A8C5PCQ4_9ANUR
MAAAALRQELTCLSVYTDPVTLPSGHSFCQICIEGALDSQLSCPECRQIVRRKTKLKRNLTLCNITKQVTSTEPEKRVKVDVPCTYCDHHVPAAKTCVLCEASLCDKHLLKHTKSSEHVLIDPTDFPEKRKCHIHEKILQYYCPEDDTCICVSCCLVGEHKGHRVTSLSEASEEKKNNMKTTLEKLSTNKEETKENVQRLWKLKTEVQEEAAEVSQRTNALIMNMRYRLETLEHQVLSETSRQEEVICRQLSDQVQKLESKREEISRKISHIEENICHMTDPLTVLQQKVSQKEEEPEEKAPAVSSLDMGLVIATLHSGLGEIASLMKEWQNSYYSNKFRNVNTNSNVLLDINTACNNVAVSGNLKMVSQTGLQQVPRDTPGRFQNCPQVLSTAGVSYGQHYYEFEGCVNGYWRLGLVYPSMQRDGDQAIIGYNDKSWGLESWSGQLSAVHDGKKINVYCNSSCSSRSRRFGVYVDYEAGRVSFYELCNPVTHLHTFTQTLHVAVGVWVRNNWIRIIT